MKPTVNESDDEDSNDDDDDAKPTVKTRTRRTVRKIITKKANGTYRARLKVMVQSFGGRSDSEFAVCKATRRSVSGWATYIEGAPISVKSEKIVALSVKEAELMAAVSCVLDLLYAKRILESMELKVELPMRLEIDNKGTVDLINNWSVGGRTRHVKRR